MAYDARQARADLLTAIAESTDALAVALAALGAAYEELDEQTGDRLEETLFRPVQVAYGRAKRTHAGFAGRSGLPPREFESASPGLPSLGVRGRVERALDAIADADAILVDLQDSMRPVEVGDAELRAGLADVREQLAPLAGAGQDFLRTLGR
jgi:hypothetical protein